MPAMKAQKGSIVTLKSEQWVSPMFGLPILLGQLGEITRINYSRTSAHRYDVKFGARSLPLDRGEFQVIDTPVTA